MAIFKFDFKIGDAIRHSSFDKGDYIIITNIHLDLCYFTGNRYRNKTFYGKQDCNTIVQWDKVNINPYKNGSLNSGGNI